MTDNEIIKALECCSKNTADCYECPLQNKWSCDKVLGKNALDLINRQKAEIEKLKAESQMADGYADALVERTKSEAIKEFAKRLKEEMWCEVDYVIIDRVVEEMVGDER